MADTTISGLANLTITSNLLLPVTNGSTTGKVTIGNINSLVTKSSIGLGSVTNDAQLKIASNLSDLNNTTSARSNLGLGNVENKSSATIRSEITSANIIATASPSIAKAWVCFTGSNGSIRSSYNVSSVTRNATGDWTVNFSSNMPDTNYAVLCTGEELNSSNYGLGSSVSVNGKTVSSVRVVYVAGNSSSHFDATSYSVLVLR